MFFNWIFVCLMVLCAAPMGARAASCERWFAATGDTHAVVVVTHGMNLAPERMDEMSQVLARQGMEVFRPAFAGHCPGEESAYLNANAVQWESDARRIHQLATKRANDLGKPLYLLAYSFSALIFQALADELPFARRVYFSPALAVKFWYPVVRFIAQIFPDFTYGSRNLPEYAANKNSSLRGFLALDLFLEKWKGKSNSSPEAGHVLAFIDPEDELVSFGGLEEIFSRRKGWRLEKISTQGKILKQSFHHLVIDSSALGETEWNRVTERILGFLREN